MKKTLFCGLVGLALLAVTASVDAGVVFTNLVFFTYTNPPDYGWNFEPSNGRSSALLLGNDGNFYGTTFGGGANYIPRGSLDQPDTYGYGTVFQMTPAGAFTTLYSFGSVMNPQGNPGGDGECPMGNLIKDAAGNLYGTTGYGGEIPNRSDGTIFEITTTGTLDTLYSFGLELNPDGTDADGRFPFAGLVLGSDGNFYGTTSTMGGGDHGTVFQFTPDGILNTLYSFPSDTNAAFDVNGGMPISELVEGRDGSFYGTTYWGGSNYDGTIFRITTNGTLTTLVSFDDSDPYPNAPLVLGTDGNFYGATENTVFQLNTNGNLVTLHEFSGGADGSGPNGLIQASDGNLYGTTSGGGNESSGVTYGTIFEITTNGTLTTLHSFSGPDGQEPQGALVQAPDGSFYGTTSYGGAGYDPANPGNLVGYGTIFRFIVPPAFSGITPTGGGVALSWNIMPGQSYQLQYATNLTSSPWFNLGRPATATNATASALEAAVSDGQRYYRLMLTQ
jgi:uncharacterized repeat protein (TIGR03803 family)